MSEWIVYSKDGLTERCRLKRLEYNGSFMNERTILATFEYHSEVAFDVFDYIVYRNEKFELESIPSVKKISNHNYEYELRFVSLKYELERCEMRDIVPNDNGVTYPTPLTFSFTGDVRYLTERIQANLDSLYGEGVWSIVIPEGVKSEEKNITISQQNCWNALSLVNTTYNLTFSIKGRVITIGGEQSLVGHVFQYGKGKGLYEIERVSDTDTGIVTKVRAYGGTRNLDYSYPKRPEWTDSVLPVSFALSPLRLMLPSFKLDGKTDYVLADDSIINEYGIREASVVYDDIYPSITGMRNSDDEPIDEIKSVDEVDDSKDTFVVYLYDLGFDLESKLTTENAQISMKSGSLIGYTFNISEIEKQEDNSYKITLGRITNEEGDTGNFNIPNSQWSIAAGDKFVLLNILMPQEYIRNAEERLFERAKEYLNEYGRANFSYNVGLHDKFLKENADIYEELIEGSKLRIYDQNLGISEDVTIQSITITENMGDNVLTQVKVTLNNKPSASTIERIQGQIKELSETSAGQFSTQSELLKQYRRKLDKPFFDRLFAAVDINGNEIPSTDLSTPIAYIKARYSVASIGGFTMYLNDNSYNLPSIYDGLPIDNNTIYWEDVDGYRVLKAKGGGGIAESVSWADITGKPEWLLDGKISYSEIEGTPDLSVYALKRSLSEYVTESELTAKGYATASSVTKLRNDFDALVDGDTLKSYVTLSGTQSISGEKNFTGGLKVNGSPIVYDAAKKYWKLEGDLLITGGLTMYGSDSSFTPSTIMDAIYVDGTTISKEGGVLKVIGGGGAITTITRQMVIDALGFTPISSSDIPTALPNPHSLKFGSKLYDGSASKTILASDLGITWDDILGRPTLLSSFTDDVVAGKYLPLSGGVVSSNAYIAWNTGTEGNDVNDWNEVNGNGLRIISSLSSTSNAPITYSTALHVKGRYGFQLASRGGANDNFYIRNIGTSDARDWMELIHSGNYSSYALPLTGGTISGNLTIGGILYATNNMYLNGWFSSRNHYFFVRDNADADWIVTNENWTKEYSLIHSGNIGSQSVNYANNALRMETVLGHIDGTSIHDLNTVIGGGDVYNYGDTNYWRNAPTGIKYGRVWNLAGSFRTDLLNGQLAWDINHNSTTDTTRGLWWRAIQNADRVSYAKWHQIAFTDSNVSSATKLQTARTIFGQSFDGTGDVSGDIILQIGTSSLNVGPKTYFHIAGRGNVGSIQGLYTGADWNAVSNYAKGALVFQTYNSDTINDAMFIDHLGNVGIGTASPESKLHVEGNITLKNNSSICVKDSNGTACDILNLGSSNNVVIARGSATNGHDTYIDGNNVYIRTSTSHSLAATLLSNGNVGIGTTSPEAKLHIVGKLMFTDWDNDGTFLRIHNANKGKAFISIYSAYGSAYVFGQDGSRFLISHNNYGDIFNILNGNVGIGITEPSQKLHVDGNVKVENGNFIGNLTGTATKATTADSATYAESAGNANALDNMDSTDFFRILGTNVNLDEFGDNSNKNGIVYINSSHGETLNAPFSYGSVLSINHQAASWMIGCQSNGELMYRHRWWSAYDTNWSAWKTIAFTDSDITGNAASATRARYIETQMYNSDDWYTDRYRAYTRWGSDNSNILDWKTEGDYPVRVDIAKKLNTARTIWGQSFDGTGNVSGSINLGRNAIGYILSEVWTDDEGNTHPWYGLDFSTPSKFATLSNWYGINLRVGDNCSVTIPSGNVGIGTTNPTSKLHISGTSGDGLPLLMAESTSNVQWNYAVSFLASNITANNHNVLALGQSHSTYNCGLLYYTHSGNSYTSNRISIGLYGCNDIINVVATKRVGINNTEPNYPLDVNNTSRSQNIVARLNNSEYHAGLNLDAASGYNPFIIFTQASSGVGEIGYSNQFGSLYFGKSGTDVGYLNIKISNGNIGIGTTNPLDKLHVAGNLRLKNNDSYYGNYIYFGDDRYCYIGEVTDDSMTIYASKGIQLMGKVNITSDTTIDGNLLVGGGITMYSAKELKNIVDERGLSLDELRAIKPTRYTWKDGRDNRIHFGGIADDIQQVLPEVVYNANGVLTMDYGNAGFVIASSLIKPVVDHEQRIKALEKENEELKQEIKRLRA